MRFWHQAWLENGAKSCRLVMFYLQNATVRFRMMATKSPNLSVPSFLIYLRQRMLIISPDSRNPTSSSASRRRSALSTPVFSLVWVLNKRIDGTKFSQQRWYWPEHTLPQLETDDEILELGVAEPAQAGLLLVHGHHHLATDLDTGAALDVVCPQEICQQVKYDSVGEQIIGSLEY